MNLKKIAMNLIMALYCFLLLCSADLLSALNERPVPRNMRSVVVNPEIYSYPDRIFFQMCPCAEHAVSPFENWTDYPVYTRKGS